uniref:Btz domain-containing protein n=1 Tax=Caenorhabditis tropicalis TaxID=1561998 RepID=A0A1I7TR62_9PELO
MPRVLRSSKKTEEEKKEKEEEPSTRPKRKCSTVLGGTPSKMKARAEETSPGQTPVRRRDPLARRAQESTSTEKTTPAAEKKSSKVTQARRGSESSDEGTSAAQAKKTAPAAEHKDSGLNSAIRAGPKAKPKALGATPAGTGSKAKEGGLKETPVPQQVPIRRRRRWVFEPSQTLEELDAEMDALFANAFAGQGSSSTNPPSAAAQQQISGATLVKEGRGQSDDAPEDYPSRNQTAAEHKNSGFKLAEETPRRPDPAVRRNPIRVVPLWEEPEDAPQMLEANSHQEGSSSQEPRREEKARREFEHRREAKALREVDSRREFDARPLSPQPGTSYTPSALRTPRGNHYQKNEGTPGFQFLSGGTNFRAMLDQHELLRNNEALKNDRLVVRKPPAPAPYIPFAKMKEPESEDEGSDYASDDDVEVSEVQLDYPEKIGEGEEEQYHKALLEFDPTMTLAESHDRQDNLRRQMWKCRLNIPSSWKPATQMEDEEE